MHFSKSISAFLLTVGLLTAAGCGQVKTASSVVSAPQSILSGSNTVASSAAAEQQAIIQQTLITLFNGPNAAYTGQGSTHILGEGVSESTSGTTESLPNSALQSAFTPDAYSTFVSNALSLYHGFAQDSGQRMQLKSDALHIEKTDAGYSFAATVQYGKTESTQQTAKVTGAVQFNDSGKLCSFRIAKDSGLMKTLQAQK